MNYVIEDYGEDNVCKSEMYANHCDLSKAEKKKKMFHSFPTPECFWDNVRSCFMWIMRGSFAGDFAETCQY